jgi:hypothetical protein
MSWSRRRSPDLAGLPLRGVVAARAGSALPAGIERFEAEQRAATPD